MDQLIFVSPANHQLGYFKEFLPRALPFGAGLLAAHLRKLGERVQLWDLEVESRSDRDILDATPGKGEGVIFAISLLTPNAFRGYKFAKRVKALAPRAKIIYGGIHPTAVPEEPLLEGEADAVVRGEGEEVFPALIRRMREKKEIAGEPGISCRDGEGRIIHGEDAPPVLDLDAYPSFPYDLVDISKYHLGMVSTSRGCPYNCIFCSQRLISGRRYRYRSTENVISELDFLINQCNQTSCMFVDDYFTANPQRVTELCAEIRARGLHKKASFAAQVRADSLKPEILREMRSSGFNSLSFGLETASGNLMTLIDKGETIPEIIHGAKLAVKEGFEIEGVFIFGFPGETLKDRLRCFRLAHEINLARVRVNNVIPYPGTRLYDMLMEQKRLTIQKGWTNFNSAGAASSRLASKFALPFVPIGTTDGALQGEVLTANILFYINFKKLKNMITKTRQPSGIGFELTFRQLFQPVKIINFILAVGTMLTRAVWFLLTEKECRQFLWRILTGRLPEFESSVREALDEHSKQTVKETV